MKHPGFFTAPAPDRGRPRLVVLSDEQKRKLAATYLKTNRTRSEGSMETAWVLFTETADGREHAWTVENRRIITRLPVAALEVMKKARPLVGADRGGSKRLRSEGPYVSGGMRINHLEGRRLLAGERYSVDDLTRNVPCWIPWPWGGCKTSDRFGVKLGRWQTLAVLDDASNAVIAVKSVFRAEQSYRGADAASLVFQVENQIGMRGFGAGEACWVVEGGVWQSQQMLTALAGRFISAKGRPNQKLIERWFGAMQVRDSINLGDMGRIRGERMEDNAIYMACRRGEKDPRSHFLCMETGQAALEETIEWMNTREVRSKIYGRWVPMERWQMDTEKQPLVTRSAEDAWVMSPERRSLTVNRKAMLACQAVGPLGVSMPMIFSAPWLWEHSGRKVDLYFDPLADWPILGYVADPKTRRLLGTVQCQASFGMSRDADVEMATAIRKTMMSELRCIVGTRARIVEARTTAGIQRIELSRRSEPEHLADREKNHGTRGAAEVLDPRHTTVAAGTPFGIAVDRKISVGESRTTRGGADPSSAAGRLATPSHDRASGGGRGVMPAPAGGDSAGHLRSLSRKAAAAREQVPNW